MKKLLISLFALFLLTFSKKFHKAKKSLAKMPTKYNAFVEVKSTSLDVLFSFFAFVNIQDSYLLFEKDGMKLNSKDEERIVGRIIKCFEPNKHCFLPYFFIEKCDFQLDDGNKITVKAPYKAIPASTSSFPKVIITFTLLNKEESSNADRVIKEWKETCVKLFKNYNAKREKLIEANSVYLEKMVQYRKLMNSIEDNHFSEVESFNQQKAKLIKAVKKEGLKVAMEELETDKNTARQLLTLFKSQLYINGDQGIFQRLEELLKDEIN